MKFHALSLTSFEWLALVFGSFKLRTTTQNARRGVNNDVFVSLVRSKSPRSQLARSLRTKKRLVNWLWRPIHKKTQPHPSARARAREIDLGYAYLTANNHRHTTMAATYNTIPAGDASD